MFFNSSARPRRRLAAFAILLATFCPGLALAVLNEEARLNTPTDSSSLSGQSVAISDDGTLTVLGAPGQNGTGAVYVFQRTGIAWSAPNTIVASDGASGDLFGASVSISGDADNGFTIAVGAPGRGSSAGAVYLYSGTFGSWTENSNILTSALTSAGSLGTSVSNQGFRVAAGAPNANVGNNVGAGVAVVFDSIDSGVTFTRSTFRPNGGQARAGSHFGASVSLSGSTVLVGSPNFHTGAKTNSGSVFVFVNNGGSYTQQARIRPANITNNFAGAAVSLFSETAAFGAPGNSSNRGAVYVYTRSGTTWTQQASITAPGGAAGDNFGSSVAQLGSFLVAGAPFANSNAGAAYEFGLVSNAYTLLNQLVATDNAAGDEFGTSVSVNAGRAAVGAPTLAPGNGGGYVFRFLQASVTTITCFSSDTNSCVSEEPSLTGVPYTVFVHVDHDIGGSGTPSGSVDVDDSAGGTCTATLDVNGDGSCLLTSNFFGSLTVTATYNGDLVFSPSKGTLGHTITGNHLVFNPTPPADVPQGTQFSGTVEVHNGADVLDTSDNTTQVTISLTDSCGDLHVFGPVTLTGGVATFASLGPTFYTIFSGLDISAISNNNVSAANSNLNVVANSDFIFADGFEDCRL
jgi:hypothetical protein